MKLTQQPNFRVEDFPSEQKWISKLFVNLNLFIQGVNSVVNGNISYTDNIKAVENSYSVDTFQSFSFQWPYTDEPKTCQVIQCQKGTDLTYTTAVCVWSYSAKDKTITISRLSEITESGVSSFTGNVKFTVRATI
jgi:hypothetical protein